MCRSSVVRVYKDGNTGNWAVSLDGKIVFICLSATMAFAIGCLTRRAASSAGRVAMRAAA
jgi:hypothetical protein